MHRRLLHKPDGRALVLYGRAPIPELPAPQAGPREVGRSHLRWHALRGEWVAYAGARQHRTFLPPPEYNPLRPSTDPAHPTEVPAGPWDVAVFENRFPTFWGDSPGEPPPRGDLDVPTRPASGACEVVVYTQDPATSLGALPSWHVELLIDVWADRQLELGARPEVAYVMPFENRGVEVGVTLHHPHGQIYAYPFVPPVPARELEQQRLHLEAHGRGLLAAQLERELTDGRRLLYRGDHAVAFLPVCARWAYEAWILPRRPVGALPALDPGERSDLARALRTVLLMYDGLWSRPMPYVMVLHQAPTDGDPHPEAHLHFEIYPALRLPGRLKYLAGSELGAGAFTADSEPEDKAAELRAVEVRL